MDQFTIYDLDTKRIVRERPREQEAGRLRSRRSRRGAEKLAAN